LPAAANSFRQVFWAAEDVQQDDDDDHDDPGAASEPGDAGGDRDPAAAAAEPASGSARPAAPLGAADVDDILVAALSPFPFHAGIIASGRGEMIASTVGWILPAGAYEL
jgi:hypothetical protein